VYTRWGRVGVQGRDKLFDFPSKELAIMEFKSKFYEKTRNNWETRQDFKPEKKKYTWLERDYTDDTEDSDPNFKVKSNDITVPVI
jgi:poly [ADP-ribose] polymerase